MYIKNSNIFIDIVMKFRSYHTLNKPDFEESGAPQYYTELGLELHRSTFRGPVTRASEQ